MILVKKYTDKTTFRSLYSVAFISNNELLDIKENINILQLVVYFECYNDAKHHLINVKYAKDLTFSLNEKIY